MVITFPAIRPAQGPRPIDPNRDFPQLTQLLRTVFADEFAAGGQKSFQSATGVAQPTLFWRLDPFLSRLVPGFVWEEDGRIVGNVTLLTVDDPRLILVANVATYAEYRRRGIARSLMEIVHEEAQRRGAKEIHLQVDRDNKAAVALYRSLGYLPDGSYTIWKLRISRYGRPQITLPRDHDQIAVIPMPYSYWRGAYRLDQMTGHTRFYWPEPVTYDEYRKSILRRITDFLSGKHFEAWMTADSKDELQGIATINGEWGRSHQLRVRVRPERQGELETVLVHKLLERLAYLPRRNVLMHHDANDLVMNELLPSLHFRQERTLTRMKLELE